MDLLAQYWPFVLGLMITGVCSGIAAGLLGIGGGAIIVPALATALSVMGFDADVVQHVAVGTSLAIIIPTGLVSARAHFRRGALDVATLRQWVPFIVAGTFIGGLVAGQFSGNVLRIVFAVMAFVIAANIVLGFQTRLMGHLHGSAATHRISASVVGFISALMGIGGGTLSVPILTAVGYDIRRAVGTASAIGFLIAIPGTIGYVLTGWSAVGLPPGSLGYVNLLAFVALVPLTALFAPVGARLAHTIPQRALAYAFGGFLIITSLKMFSDLIF